MCLEINGLAVTADAGTSILRAAAESDIPIPKLCALTHSTHLVPVVCASSRLKAAGLFFIMYRTCFRYESGTQSPKLAKLRRGIMELYISDHPDCLTCSDNGDCELQDVAGRRTEEVRYEEGNPEI